MTAETTPTPKTTGELTLAELLTLLRETVAEALGGIVGYPDAKLEPRPDAGAAAGPEAGADGSKAAHPATGSRVRIVDDEAAVAAKMARKVSDLSVDDLEWWVYYIVDEVGEELIGDPDAGLELSAWAQEQLERSAADIAAGRTIPAAQVAKEVGLEWPDDV
ncbi:MAG: hypothetical protein OXL37_04375 [Chloroflexota bacterium]|nr:hypothetical protein [Chloroflexota bacterium]MDE2960946.1 hypothetical protein [Chloroflexota bacterium]